MNKFLILLLFLGAAASASAQTRAPAPASAAPPANPTPAQASPLDGEWKGTSDGGSCNAPLEYQLTIESGFVDGSAYDTTARGPVPNPSKAAPPPPGPGLWQIHGVARSGGTFTLLSVASVKGTEHRRIQLTARSDGGGLVVTENGGCRRTARLARG
ncbi:MAG: hypothetical protein EPO55_21285 [Reyranella sp.]|uniref:hypothetical protein n=1 Tax=Reyranella sp. TaxID=1929291 RepID=UPI0011FB3F83|nr:hypothetical protein [Reyranella sp.]TAJ36611.1 MAG: hypothetical protein EPO55_21285 [Reyranella sp.]